MLTLLHRFLALGATFCAIVLVALDRVSPGYTASAQDDPLRIARLRMVDTQIAARGISSRPVLEAMKRVPRHLFVPAALQSRAYEDTPLVIGQGQTISQPFIVAYMTDALRAAADEKVLEIGTGSGYQAAVLAELVREVYTIEIVPELADRARRTLTEAGYRNVQVRTGNGYLGWPEQAPFPRIIVTKNATGVVQKRTIPVRFVPMVGKPR